MKPPCRAISAFRLAAPLAAALGSPAGLWAQCAMCRTALTSSPEGQRWAQGIDSGIILLLLAPFVIVAGIALHIYSGRLHVALRIYFQRGRQAFARRRLIASSRAAIR